MSIRRTPDAQHYTLDEILRIDLDRLCAGAASADDDRHDGAGVAGDRSSASAAVFNPDVDHRIDELGCSVPATFDGDGKPETIPSPPFLSLTEAADWLAVSLSTVKRLVDRHELATVRIGARRKIPLSELKHYALQRLVGRSMPFRKLQGNTGASAEPAKTPGD